MPHRKDDVACPTAPIGSPSESLEQDLLEPIAVIGFSLRMPQDAVTPQAFWKMLEEKRCVMTDWPKDRINVDAFYHPNHSRRDTIYARGAHFLKDDVAAFDASFFSITSNEAGAMDPQQRILLETSYRALENAGIPIEKASGSKTGVYTGSMGDDYRSLSARDLEEVPTYSATGSAASMLANRLSWFFNFNGPSINLDSACSSSLMALDFACQGLRNGDSSMALVAGANILLSVDTSLSLTNMNFLSSDSRCYSFDERANGYSRGEGFGVVVIKRLSDAIDDGDAIRAIIRSTGSNQDGHTPGITQPRKGAQAQLIKETYRKAGLSFDATRFFEAHGTGTPVGDPIEADAIASVFRRYRTSDDPLFIGAVKTNIGHLEGASGIAGLIKTIMVLEKGIIPPNANFELLNSKIDAEFSNIKIPVECTPWPSQGLRRASVNSFGFGGSNSHAILEDAFNFLRLRGLKGNHCTSEESSRLSEMSFLDPGSAGHIQEPTANSLLNGQNLLGKHNGAIPDQILTNGHVVNGDEHKNHRQKISNVQLLVWAAADERGLLRIISDCQNHFSLNSEDISRCASYLEDLAYTLGSRRSSLPWKSFAVIESVNALSNINNLVSKAYRSSEKLGVGFIFTGQGAQYKEMGIGLLGYPIFESTLRSVDEIFGSLGCQWSLFDKLFDRDDRSNIDSSEYSQPLCTALQIALVELLRSFNLMPSAVVGHSSGEIAAAYTVGGLSLHSACRVSYFRGKLTQEYAKSARSPGAMMSVGLSETRMQSFIHKIDVNDQPGSVTVACINSPDNVTVSGDETLIDRLLSALEGDQIFARKLNTGIAYHSPRMQEIAGHYQEAIQGLSKANCPSRLIVLSSSLTGKKVSNLDILSSADYWVSNLIKPVRFSEALSCMVSRLGAPTKKKLGQLHQNIINDVLEIGPHSTLKAPIKQVLEVAAAKSSIRYHSTLSRREPSAAATLKMAGDLYLLGYPVFLHEVNQTPKSEAPSRRLLVDLPEYPFDHTQTYWHESRLSKGLKLRHHPRLELLGTSTPESNALEARWRKFFDVAETPWIDEHKVSDRAIYPAAGMIVMALEGARQLAQKDRHVMGYQFRDTTFSNPIPINPSGARTETQLYLRHLQNTFEKETASFQFRICILDDHFWSEVCQGTMQIQYKGAQSEFDEGGEESERRQQIKAQYEEALRKCRQPVTTERMYQHFKDIGLTYGRTFQALQNLAWNGKEEAIGNIQSPQWSVPNFQNPVEPHIIHPVTLDAAAQLMWVSLTEGGTKLIATGVPTRMRSAWISGNNLGYPEPTVLRGYSISKFKGLRKTEASMFAIDQTGDLKLSISGMETTNVSSQDSSSPESSGLRKFCYAQDWKPDISLMTNQQILAYCEAGDTGGPEPTDFYRDLESVLYSYISRTLEQVSEAEVESSKPHMKKHFAWIKMQQTTSRLGQLSDSEAERVLHSGVIDSLADRLEATNAQGKLFVTVGRNLPSLIRGTADPLELLFHNGIAEAFYQDVFNRTSCCRKIWNYLDGLAHKNPALRILEVGAGTGSMTDHVLAPLLLHGEKERGTARFGRYDYTDISEAFFENARQRFGPETQGMHFRSLNIEHEPAMQGFELETYDLIIASSVGELFVEYEPKLTQWQVLHATRDLSVTIQNVRKLLKRGGKLILFEVTEPEKLRAGFGFGVLPGWWMGTEDSRKWSPCISSNDWNILLSQNQFSGVDFEIRDYQNESCHEMSILVSTATEDTGDLQPASKTVILLNTNSELQNDMARHICNKLESSGHSGCEILDVDQISRSEDPRTITFIFLPEIESPFLYDMDNVSYKLLQTMVSIAHRLLWVTHTNKDLESSPKFDMVSGLARVLRSENRNQSLITLALEDSLFDVASTAECVVRILGRNHSDHETEFVKLDGILMIHRIVEAHYLDQAVYAKIGPQSRKQEFGLEPAMKMKIGAVGLLDTLQWVEDAAHSLDLASNEIEIEVKAVGINFRDLFVALGRHDGDSLGCECAGIVTRVGQCCESLQQGDRVCAVIIGCMNTYARCDAQLAVKIPADLSFVEAAAIPLTGSTAYNSLVEVARLQKGETVLIHSASGGTGQMAVQVARSVGAEIYATVGSDEKKRLLMNLYDIPEDHIFYSRNSTFAQGIAHMTQDRGVDVVLNSLSGESLTASWDSMAPFGRFVEIGKSDIEANAKLSMSGFARNVTFSAVALDYTCTHRPDILRRTLVATMDMVRNKSLKVAYPLNVNTVSGIEEALRSIQSGKNTGKTVLEIKPNDVVPTFLQPRTCNKFDSCASYVIAGGLGGLGRSAATWMAARGAKNLILLSRSGGQGSEAAADLVKGLKGLGIIVKTPKCDVASIESLASALADCADMPPIKGCIQGTMVLQDSIFENMSFANWNTTIRSKANSSWNLHVLLPRKLDFFIMLSSVAGVIGSVSQANYAAGNAYQGGLARHRIFKGEKAIALDLGWMGSVGIIAENEKYRRNKEDAQDMAQIEENEFHALLDYYCDSNLELASPMKAEPIVGLVTAAQFRSKGLEPPDWMQWPAFSRLAQVDLANPSSTSSELGLATRVDYRAELLRASSVEEAGGVVVAGLVRKLIKVLSASSAEEIDIKKPLHAYGVDSLLAVELRNWFAKEFQAEVAIFDLMGAESITKVGEVVAERSRARKEG